MKLIKRPHQPITFSKPSSIFSFIKKKTTKWCLYAFLDLTLLNINIIKLMYFGILLSGSYNTHVIFCLASNHKNQKEFSSLSLKNISPMASSLNPFILPGSFNSSKETLISSNGYLSNSIFSSDLTKRSNLLLEHKGCLNARTPVHVHASLCLSKSMRWWEKTLKPNLIEINSAQELVDTLANSGGRLVIVEFYSSGCGGCKALHPKICQLAELNPNAMFLQVNYEELKPMCHALHVHVLPFFRFYKGHEGKICSFSCTTSTIKKFKDALSKHKPDVCDLGPAKGLEESELLALASIGQISYNLPLKSTEDDLILKEINLSRKNIVLA